MLIKIPLQLTKYQTIPWKLFTKFLCLQLQNDVPTIWAEDSKGQEEVGFDIYMYYTGETPMSRLKYLVTFQLNELVYHVYSE